MREHVLLRQGTGTPSWAVENLQQRVEAETWRLHTCGGDHAAGPWLLSLPGSCRNLVTRQLCSSRLDTAGVEALVSLLHVSRSVYEAFAPLAYDLMDPGCVAELEQLRQRRAAKVAQIQHLAHGASRTGAEGGGSSNQYWQAVRQKAAAQVLASLPRLPLRMCAVRPWMQRLRRAHPPQSILQPPYWCARSHEAALNIGDPAALVEQRAWALHCSNGDPAAGPWLLSLPKHCLNKVITAFGCCRSGLAGCQGPGGSPGLLPQGACNLCNACVRGA